MRSIPLLKRLRILRHWLPFAVMLVALAALLGWQNGLGRVDQTLYDAFLTSSGRPARDDIVIVAIDDQSLAQIGRWPWPRAIHAQLIDQISAAKPKAIGLDLILAEPESPLIDGSRPNDRMLAESLKRSGLVVLPITVETAGAGMAARPPVTAFAQAARQLGHIRLNIDDDGVARSIYLEEGDQQGMWPHFAAALAAVERPAAAKAGNGLDLSTASSGMSWQRNRKMQIAYAGGSGHFRTIPYGAVLRGEVPATFFNGKYVLIGATAAGMTDAFPTPVSGANGAMPGIEINANILAGLLDGKAIAVAAAWQNALFCMLPLLLAMAGYWRLSPRGSLILTGLLLGTTLLASAMALAAGLWLPPAAALIALTIAYPLWSWRRLDAVIRYLGEEFARLEREPHLLPEALASQPPARKARHADVLEQRIGAMTTAARRVRDLRRFISDSLDHLPDATIVTAVDGHVLLPNLQASIYFATLGIYSVHDTLLPYLLATLAQPQPLNHTANTHFEWWHLFDVDHVLALESGVGVQDSQGRDLLIKSAPCYSAAQDLIGWIVSIIDISVIRQAERQHDETLRFLSHDMRAPQASILALLELQNDPASALPQEEFFMRIEKACRKTLSLADNFVQLARAESEEYRFEAMDLQEVIFDATDEMWTLAKNKHIYLATDVPKMDFPVRIDRSLMTRTLINLIANAINYSPSGTRITCSVRIEERSLTQQIVCRVMDQGYGIAPVDQVRMFRRFQRMELPDQPRHDGIGLGLVFVKTVVERHGGKISFKSRVGKGTIFTIALPIAENS